VALWSVREEEEEEEAAASAATHLPRALNDRLIVLASSRRAPREKLQV